MPASPAIPDENLLPAFRVPRRVRHEPRRRQLEVKGVERIAAHMIRVTLGGDLEGFVSLGFDDHVKHRKGAEAGTTDVLAKTLGTLSLPRGDYYAWIACESLAAKALRAQLIAERGANPKWIRAAGYWRRGAAAVHETHSD